MFGTVEEQEVIANELQECPCCQRCILRYLGFRIPSQFKGNSPSEIINKILHKTASSDLKTDNATLSDEATTPSSLNATKENTANDVELVKNDNNGDTKSRIEIPKKENGEEIDNAMDVGRSEGEEGGLLCISCLGTLQDKYSSLFVSKVIATVQEADHKFESFQLSVSLSVQFILRQHAIWKHLQTNYESVYSKRKLDEISTIKDVLKWVYGPKLSSPLDVRFSPMSLFEIGLSISHAATSRECDFLIPDTRKRSEPPSKRRRKLQNFDGVSRTVVQNKLSEMPTEELQRQYPWPPYTPSEACVVNVTISHAPVFVAGRYNKYSRTLSQTPWLIDGERKTQNSVEEYICIPIKKKLQAKDYKFSSSGREDVDVLTLGRGRPFLVELLNPHRALQGQEDMTELQEFINSRTEDVAVSDLQMVTKEETKKLKEGETSKTKSYNAKIWVEEAKTPEDLKILETFKDLVIYQKTPIRVLHRRNLATRERVVHSMQAQYIDDHHFQLNLSTQAGTYIKEFVHSDFGRTEPNLGSLLKCHVDILELDVASVDLDWPKKLDNTNNQPTNQPQVEL
ncbi:putative tRNA pseudouridine synthase Pus10 [Anneissia japonica]|uniref:putative tRNA pseudouridine synthase Pus10 n=1 Tax=Anneissia japonica TaxID=1529436 RepID=UPI001425A660|nr:putative tRNA pseudouridine synthase Pus10 [Anneissia japonica]XP_033127910.1 putative tRNA pseudouridine synthase Pus10 [Anneissia japonica]